MNNLYRWVGVRAGRDFRVYWHAASEEEFRKELVDRYPDISPEHGTINLTPSPFCYMPQKCAGGSSCRARISCNE